MDTPKRTNVPIAVERYSNLNSSPRHITTANFMEYAVARCKELPKNATYSFDMSSTVRLKPMQSPTYGRMEIHNRAFFVPFRLVMQGFNDFNNDVPFYNDLGTPINISSCHRIANSTFVNYFLRTDVSKPITTDVSGVLANKAYDFVRYESGSAVPYKFTSLGRYSYKVLRQLGYGVYFNGSTSLGSGPYSSALPLLCWMRIFFDWYFPSMYVDDNRANQLRRWFNITPTSSTAFQVAFSGDDLYTVFTELRRVSYDTDYFTSVWDNPNSPTSGSFSAISVSDPTVSSLPGKVGTLANGTAILQDASGNAVPRNVSTYLLDMLKSVSDYMKRNQIAGARTIDRFTSRWGSAPISEKIMRSQYISESISPIRVGDVTATADSDGMPLGGYAGKGYGQSSDNNFVNYTAEEFGMVIVISTIVPEPIYYQGVLRHTMHLNRFDFYTPEFDNKGVQAVSTREVFMPTGTLASADQSTAINFDNAVFGFLPRYADYKVEPSQITGDITLGSLNTGMEGWTLGRDLDSYFEDTPYANVVHSQEFLDGSDALQYNRIFDYTGEDEDKFIVEHRFDVRHRFPGSPLYDGYEFDTAGKAPTVSIDVNGTRAN